MHQIGKNQTWPKRLLPDLETLPAKQLPGELIGYLFSVESDEPSEGQGITQHTSTTFGESMLSDFFLSERCLTRKKICNSCSEAP